MNHMAQPSLTSPTFICQIGFVAVMDIRVGDEVVWDYGMGKSKLVDGAVAGPSDFCKGEVRAALAH